MMNNNELEKFFKAFARDREILGEELTVGIYEDIFSYFMEKPVKGFYEVSQLISEDGTLNVGFEEDELCEGVIDKLSGWMKNAKEEIKSVLPGWMTGKGNPLKKSEEIMPNVERTADALNTAAGAAGEATMQAIEAAKNAEKASGFASWFNKAKNSIKNFFKGDNIKRLLNNGVAWFTNPANAKKILGGAGGLVLLTIIIKSLKKRHQLKNYKNLQALYNQGMTEDFEDNETYWEIVEECQTNKRLYDLMFTDDFLKEKYHSNYMNY